MIATAAPYLAQKLQARLREETYAKDLRRYRTQSLPLACTSPFPSSKSFDIARGCSVESDTGLLKLGPMCGYTISQGESLCWRLIAMADAM